MRRQNVDPEDIDDETAFSKLGSIPMTQSMPEERKKEVENVLRWLGDGKPIDHDSADEFRRLDQILPTKKGESPEDRARDIESALDWCRSNNVSSIDEDVINNFSKIASFPLSLRSPEDRQRDCGKALTWLRAGKRADIDTPDGQLSKLDQMLPTKRFQSPEERAKEIESAMDWCRNQCSAFRRWLSAWCQVSWFYTCFYKITR
jgi:hypothetical protein